MNPEKTFVDSFILPDKKDRYRALLASPKRRSDILMRIYHSLDYVPQLAFKVPAEKQNSEDIQKLLCARGASDTCHSISNIKELDGRSLSLADALDTVVGTCIGTILICIPDKLAYYEAEDLGCRYILQK